MQKYFLHDFFNYLFIIFGPCRVSVAMLDLLLWQMDSLAVAHKLSSHGPQA